MKWISTEWQIGNNRLRAFNVTSQKTYVEEKRALQITGTSRLFYITFFPSEELSILKASAYKIFQNMLKLRLEKTDIRHINSGTTGLYYSLGLSDVTQCLPMFRRTLLRSSAGQRTYSTTWKMSASMLLRNVGAIMK